MELRALKLFIINQVLQTQDPAVLQTVANLLSAAQTPSVSAEQFNPEWQAEEAPGLRFSEEHSRDLQASIDDLFNP